MTTQVQQPTDLATPLPLRVLGDLGGYLVVGVVLIGVLEVLVSLASRRLLVARAGLLPDGPGERTESRLAVAGALRLVRHPFRVIPVAAVSWGVALGAMLAGAASVTPRMDGHPPEPPGPRGLRATWSGWRAPPWRSRSLCTVWLAVLCLCGLATAFRTALWTMDTLR